MERIESTACKENQVLLHCAPKEMLYPIDMELKERLIRARENVGLNKSAVAKEIGVSPQAVGQWELDGGTKPSRDHLFALAKLYRIPVTAFEDGQDLPKPEPDMLEEFLGQLLALAKRVPEAQRARLIGLAEGMIPAEPRTAKRRSGSP